MKAKGLLILIALGSMNAAFASDGKPLPDGEARDLIIRGSISSFEGDCPCPYNINKERNECGENSAYRQNPGSVKCYPGDISDSELKQFRNLYNVPEPKLPWDREKKPSY